MIARVIIRIAAQDIENQPRKQFFQRYGGLRKFTPNHFGQIWIACIAAIISSIPNSVSAETMHLRSAVMHQKQVENFFIVMPDVQRYVGLLDNPVNYSSIVGGKRQWFETDVPYKFQIS
jgi:hypothetical protein